MGIFNTKVLIFNKYQKIPYLDPKVDGFEKSQKTSFFVIPAKAGIQSFQILTTDLDPDFRRGDEFLRVHQS
jgi:hypothetical protein